jgi:hypothetical protein
MKHFTLAWSFAILLAIIPSVSFAAEQHKSVTFDQTAVIGTQQLKPGTYTLKWDDSQPNTTVDFQNNGKTVATAPAQIVHQSNPDNASFEFNTSSGQNQLDRIYTAKEQLLFGPASTNSQSNSSTPNPSSE